MSEGNLYWNIMKIPKPKVGIKNVSRRIVFQKALNCLRYLLNISRLPQYNTIPRIKGRNKLYGFFSTVVFDVAVVSVCELVSVTVEVCVVVEGVAVEIVPTLKDANNVVASP
jgi:hypothetical protein